MSRDHEASSLYRCRSSDRSRVLGNTCGSVLRWKVVDEGLRRARKGCDGRVREAAVPPREKGREDVALLRQSLGGLCA